MVKHTQTIPRHQPTNCLSVFDHFVGLALKELTHNRLQQLLFFFFFFLTQLSEELAKVFSSSGQYVPS